MNTGPRRSIKEMVPIHQNFIEPHNYQSLFKSPLSTRQRQQRPSKLPSFKMPSGQQQAQVPVSPPISPQLRTRNMSRAEQRMFNVDPPQVLYKAFNVIFYYCLQEVNCNANLSNLNNQY